MAADLNVLYAEAADAALAHDYDRYTVLCAQIQRERAIEDILKLIEPNPWRTQ